MTAGHLFRAAFATATTAALLAAASTVAPAQVPATRAAVPDTALTLDPAVRRGTLPNGLQYLIRHARKPEHRAELRLVVRVGSVHEDADQQGLAHFVEHMAFNGTRNFRRHELRDYLELVGMKFGAHLNAYTSFDETVYMLTIPTDSAPLLETGVQILEDWAHGITFEADEVEAERGVVLGEWRGRLGADDRTFRAHFPTLMRDSKYAERLPIGTPAHIEHAPREALLRFYRDWYRADLMTVVAVGDFDVDAMEARLRRHFSRLARPTAARPRPRVAVPLTHGTLVSTTADEEATASIVSVAVKVANAEGVATSGGYRARIIAAMFENMLNSRLAEVADKPGAPYLGAGYSLSPLVEPVELATLSARVRDNDFVAALRAMVREMARVAQHGFTPGELAREKASQMRRGEQLYLERDNILAGTTAHKLTRMALTGAPLLDTEASVVTARRLMSSITAEDLQREAARWLEARPRVVMTTATQRGTGRSGPTEAQLLAAFAEARAATVAAYVEPDLNAPLLSTAPAPGTIVETTVHASVGVTEWLLSNGARVFLKPTDYRADEVLISASSPGGIQMASDSDFATAALVNELQGASGFGSYNARQLGRRIAGKIIDVRQTVQQLNEEWLGRSSRRDLPTTLELLYLMFTQAREDSSAMVASAEKLRSAMIEHAAGPVLAFQDTIRAVMAQYHHRAPTPSPALLDRVRFARVPTFFRERFSNGGDFTFTFVGAFAVEDIKPLVLQYIGGLPSTGTRETTPDVRIPPPPGTVRRTMQLGREPQTYTAIAFHGAIGGGSEEWFDVTALTEVLKLRLTQRIREDLAGSYGVQVQTNVSYLPGGNSYGTTIVFIADPARREELTAATFAVIDSLRTVGPTEQEVAKVRSQFLRQNETARLTNEMWTQLGQLRDRGWSFDLLLDDSRPQGMTVESVRQSARRFLDTTQYAHFVLEPSPGSGSQP